MAPVGALGITALAESNEGEEDSWRWRCFSIGGVLGMAFGFIYLGVPAITVVPPSSGPRSVRLVRALMKEKW